MCWVLMFTGTGDTVSLDTGPGQQFSIRSPVEDSGWHCLPGRSMPTWTYTALAESATSTGELYRNCSQLLRDYSSQWAVFSSVQLDCARIAWPCHLTEYRRWNKLIRPMHCELNWPSRSQYKAEWRRQMTSSAQRTGQYLWLWTREAQLEQGNCPLHEPQRRR